MLTKRIIPCLDIKDGRVVKGVNFVNLVDAGSAVENACFYNEQGADELVFLDITATHDKRNILCDLVEKIAKHIQIPFTVGGGLANIEDIRLITQRGADKVSLNSAAVKNPHLLTEIAKLFGSQCVVAAIDAKREGNTWNVYIKGGREKTGINAITWAKEVQDRGAGEILLTSMDRDGTKTGFDLELTRMVADSVNIPVIASGGVGSINHLIDGFEKGKADAALAASIFHFRELSIGEVKNSLAERGIPMRLVANNKVASLLRRQESISLPKQ